MISSIIIDDEVHCLETLELLLRDYCPDVEIAGKYGSAKLGLEAIRELKPELVFLDIEMPVMNGFEMLEQLKETSFSIIFTTSYDQYAIRAIKFSAMDYLLKPIERAELIQSVEKVKKYRLHPTSEHLAMLVKKFHGKENGFSKIAIPTSEGFELIYADQVVRCEADNNYTLLYLKNKVKLTACRTLKEIEEQLEPFTIFIRVHNSFVVNLNEVTKYVRGEGGYLIMSDGSAVHVSRSRKDALMKRLTRDE